MTDLDKREICLRPEKDEDKNFLLQLYISTRESELKPGGWPQAEIHSFLTQQFEAQYFSYRQLYPDAEYQLIEYQSDAIGRHYLDRGVKEYRLIDIALLPAFRNRSLGAYLIQTILDEAAEIGKLVTLHVEYSNPAYRLYERLGFIQVENRGIYSLMQWQPAGST